MAAECDGMVMERRESGSGVETSHVEVGPPRAGVAELVDALDLGSSGESCGGRIPPLAPAKSDLEAMMPNPIGRLIAFRCRTVAGDAGFVRASAETRAERILRHFPPPKGNELSLKV